MSVAVVGDTQAVAVAAYVAAVSQRRVHLVREDAIKVRQVELGVELCAVDVVTSTELPAQLDALIVVAESRGLRELVRPMATRLSGVPVLLAPGGFAGVLRARAWFKEWGLQAPDLAEATGFPVGADVVGQRLVLRGIKHNLPVAAVDQESTRRVHRVFADLLPHLIASDLITTSLSNTNHMIHPGVVLANASRVDNGEPFRLYRGGLSQVVRHLLEAVDGERLQLMDRLGVAPRTLRDWMVGFYESEGMAGQDIVQCLQTFPPFADVPGPSTLNHRYLLDDVPFGVAQWSALARHLDVEVPHTDALLSSLRTLAPHLDLAPDAEAAHLLLDHLAITQGVLS